jgi:hypothetical protein
VEDFCLFIFCAFKFLFIFQWTFITYLCSHLALTFDEWHTLHWNLLLVGILSWHRENRALLAYGVLMPWWLLYNKKQWSSACDWGFHVITHTHTEHFSQAISPSIRRNPIPYTITTHTYCKCEGAIRRTQGVAFVLKEWRYNLFFAIGFKNKSWSYKISFDALNCQGPETQS